MSIFINSMYTHKHGYDFHIERSPPDMESFVFDSSSKTADKERAAANFAKPLLIATAASRPL